jgi:hypothetical protein
MNIVHTAALAVITLLAGLSPGSVWGQTPDSVPTRYTLVLSEEPSNTNAKLLCNLLEDIDPASQPRFSADRRSLSVNTNKNLTLAQLLQYAVIHDIRNPEIHLDHGSEATKAGEVLITYGNVTKSAENEK